MDTPEVDFARSGDVSIAYQVVGEGPIDLVYVPFQVNVPFTWTHPLFADFYRRLASFSRLILFDKRGTGMSDRPRTRPTLEAQMDDLRAVLEAVGSEQAALFGSGHGAQMCALFAATYPERTSALVLYNCWARLPGTPEEHREALRRIPDVWGRREAIERMVAEEFPSLADDESFTRWMALAVRVANSPGGAAEFFRTIAEADISDVLPTIRVPTLVLYRTHARSAIQWVRALDVEARRLAAAIPDARLVAIPGRDMAPVVGEEVTAEVERFLAAPLQPPVPDRVLATVLFTDIASSTARAAELGDRAWRELLAAHRGSVRRELARFRGEEVETAGDGFLATFDGPARAIACAQAIIAGAREQALEVRAGLHTGECELESGKVAGIAVHIGARVAAAARPGEVLVSSTVKDLVAGSGIVFRERGVSELKGVPGKWRLYAVDGV